ncbi:universal stress protein [Streptomyces flavochromogenes]|uniref:Universal stress protein n=1 Tax=Streptomyces flavochromogenes TaxID=68199 RepID=A0ABW6Y3V1_9ACTN|nr:universal stress protein [Streptomyces flavochromogenes]
MSFGRQLPTSARPSYPESYETETIAMEPVFTVGLDGWAKRLVLQEQTMLGTLGRAPAVTFLGSVSSFLGSVSPAVVARAARPAVPGGREAREAAPSSARAGLVVALQRYGSCDDLLAIVAASAHGIPFQAVHGRSRPIRAHTPSGPGHDITDDVTDDAQRQPGQGLRPWHERFPNAEPTDAVRLKGPAEAVVSAAEGAEPQVVGRRERRPALATPLGSVPQASPHHAGRPVAVVHHD